NRSGVLSEKFYHGERETAAITGEEKGEDQRLCWREPARGHLNVRAFFFSPQVHLRELSHGADAAEEHEAHERGRHEAKGSDGEIEERKPGGQVEGHNEYEAVEVTHQRETNEEGKGEHQHRHPRPAISQGP